MSILSRPYFYDEQNATDYLERMLWPSGPRCPLCGSMRQIARFRPNPKVVRLGRWKCRYCRREFRVTVGTLFNKANLPLSKGLQAIYLATSSKDGISATQLEPILEVSYGTACLWARRIREAMRSSGLCEDPGSGSSLDERADIAASQIERFRNAARQLGCDPDETRWEERLRRVAAEDPRYSRRKRRQAT